jgi:hypothetical protein
MSIPVRAKRWPGQIVGVLDYGTSQPDQARFMKPG